MKELLSLVGLFGVVVGLHSATLPVTGSFFLSSLVSGTNAFWVPPAATTNLVSSNAPAVEVSGAGALAIETRVVGVSAPGATNNGAVYLQFAASLDGVTYTTDTNSLQIVVPTKGTRYDVWQTNVAASALGGVAYLRLLSIGQTNIGGCWFSNVTYRFLQTK